MLTHPSELFYALAPQVFTRARDWPRFASTHPKRGLEVPRKIL